MIKKGIYILFSVVLLLFTGCKTQKEIVGKKNIHAKRPEFILKNLQKSEFTPEWLKIKVSVGFKTTKTDDSFKMNIRLRKDSAIWVSSTYYSVEVARFLITKDSVKFMDRKDKRFYVGTYEYLSDKYDIDLSFESIQSIVLGNSIGINDTAKMDSYVEDNLYVLSTFRKRKVRKATDDKPDNERRLERMNEIAFLNWISPENFKIKKLSINDFKLKKSIYTEYQDFEKIANQLAPKKYTIKVLTEEEILLDVEYNKIEVDEPVSFSFNIPDKYEPIEY